MAITKLMRLKESPRGSPAAHLKHNLFYICNPEKCESGIWIGGNAGTSPEIIFQTMMENKKYWGKEDGSQGFHYVISFSPELSVTQEMAYQIAEDFAAELLGDRFYYAFAVHNDRHHMHVHITFDSVSKVDGFKFHSPKGDWEKRIQPITDRICKKYGLPALEFTEEKKGKTYDQWKHDRDSQAPDGEKSENRSRGDISWYDLIRDDIDQAISVSNTFEEVLGHLEEKGYRVKLGKYLSLHPYGRERAVRSSRLGKGYTIEEIRQRVAAKEILPDPENYIRYGNSEEIIAVIRLKRSGNRTWRMTPFQRHFYRRWRNSFLRNKPGRPQPWKANGDVVRIRRLSNAVKYMIDQDIDSFEALEGKWAELQKQKDALKAERSALATKLYRRSPLGELSKYEKLKRSTEGKPSAQDAEQMASLLSKIEKVMTLDQARTLREEIKTQIREIRKKEARLKDEGKLMDDLYTFYFEMPSPAKTRDREEVRTSAWKSGRTPAPDRMTDAAVEKGGKGGEEKRDAKMYSEKTEQGGFPETDLQKGNPKESHEGGKSARPEKWTQERTRITVHKKLIIKNDDGNGYVVKIPGREELLRIPREDALLYKSGEILSAFIYEEQRYSIYDMEGNELRSEKGSIVKSSFAARRDKKKETQKAR